MSKDSTGKDLKDSKTTVAKDSGINPDDIITDELKNSEVVPKTKEKVDPKMGVTRFLQLHRQNYLTECLLKAEYGNSVMRESEWNEKLNELLKEKITK